MASNTILSFFLWQLALLSAGPHFLAMTHAAGGQWALLSPNIGITAMHMQLLPNDRVVIYDRTDFGTSNISLANGKCRFDPRETVVKHDCTAHSVEYDVASNTIRPLTVQTDVWCSSGALMPDGSLVQTGGFNDGIDIVRVYRPCSGCDWEEIGSGLIRGRWYATNHILPDGRQIIIGGRQEFNYEFYPKIGSGKSVYSLPFLAETNDPRVENNLYPFVFLNVDGNLFIFANNRAISFNYGKGIVVKEYPQMPDGNPRSNPSTGSAVLLPLKNLRGQAIVAEVLVCGGAPKGSYISNAQNGHHVRALNTCGRIKITDPSPQWVMETMPLPRVMGDMLLLPNGEVLIINGASAGAGGWENGRNPALTPVIYRPDNAIGSRFELQNPSTIPRLYHSTALLLRDGRVLVGGSNPHVGYEFAHTLFPTELRLEAFSPSYLDPANLHPKIISLAPQAKLGYEKWITVRFTIPGSISGNLVRLTMVAPSFNTHAFSMNQRLLVLDGGNVKTLGKSTYEIGVVTPGSSTLAPSGYYLLFVVHQEIPSEGVWIHIA